MDKLIFGLTVTVIGIAVVFCGLVVLIGLIKLVAMATGGISKPKKEKAAPAPAPAPAPVPAAPVAETQPVQADDALIAVISAAVAAMMEEGSAFTVRRIRRVSNATAWSRAGREEQVYSRF